MSRLPAFFQASQSTTVIDELTNYELAADNGSQHDAAADALLADDASSATTSAAARGGFGDLNDDKLPEFFKSSLSLTMTENDRLNIMASLGTTTTAAAAPPGFQSRATAATTTTTAPVLSLAELRARQMLEQREKQQQQQQQHPPYFSTPLENAKNISSPLAADNSDSFYSSRATQQQQQQQQRAKPTSYAAAMGPPAVPITTAAVAVAAPLQQQQLPVQPSAGRQIFGNSSAAVNNNHNNNSSNNNNNNYSSNYSSNNNNNNYSSNYSSNNNNTVATSNVLSNIALLPPPPPLFNKQHPLLFSASDGFSSGAGGDAARLTFLRSQGRQLLPPHDVSSNTAVAANTAADNITNGSYSSEQQQQQQQQQQLQQQQPRSNVPRGKCMTPSDIRFIVNRVLQPMESTDPFSDDFYFLQLSIKKNAAAREAALRSAQPPPPMIFVPLPTWKETKERIKLQLQLSKQNILSKSRDWAVKEQTLGHNERIDVHRPKAKLSMPDINDVDFDLNDDEDFGDMKNPFSSRLWTMRQSVQRGYEALYTVQELQHLLTSPPIAANPLVVAEITREIDQAVALLSQSVGIRHAFIPTGQSNNSGSSGVLGATGDFSLDGGHVGAILQTNIGRKLISRSLKLLSPPHRWALLPLILAKTLLSTSAATTAATTATVVQSAEVQNAAAESVAVEQKLLRTIIEFLQYSYQFQIEQQQQAEQQQSATALATPYTLGNNSNSQQQQQQQRQPAAVAGFTDVLLSNLRQCIKSVMITQMEKSRLVQALISERTRAEVMHIVVQIGDKVSAVASANIAEEWKQTREAFVAMLDH